MSERMLNAYGTHAMAHFTAPAVMPRMSWREKIR